MKTFEKMTINTGCGILAWENHIKEPGIKIPGSFRGDGGIRTLVPRRANAFRVRPVMTASIRLQL